MDLRGKRILVLGLGETGLSMARWLAHRGAAVRVADSREHPPRADDLARELANVRTDFGAFSAESFEGADLIAISPGVPAAEPLVRRAAERGVPIVGDIELFARSRPRESAVIAITGSNGKSTVTAMAGAMCEAAGWGTVMAGNIGLPVLDALSEHPRARVYVLELSSFQLETTYSLNACAAAMLNLSQDHLDRYDDLASYAAAKARIFQGEGMQVLNRDDPWSMDMRLSGRAVNTFGLDAPPTGEDWGIHCADAGDWLARGSDVLMPVGELGVPGRHNAANALAAMALCRAVGVPDAPMLVALRSFHGLPHRMQPVAERDGVTFYDDSKGTNVGATAAALRGLAKPCVLIAGGEGKGQDFTPLAAPVCDRARAVVLIGRDREVLRSALAATGVRLLLADTLEQAVRLAYAAAFPGDAVLLSPACASFDMFRDYRQRGEEFARLARQLALEAKSSH
ncbi:MAG: UDP-N-acetylmuramoyl-L-alanine--D-glutamate ligase [Betaproteobacteria bacterium]|nr:MAG: UDP-N-acetylmuramoyl-L-alanine--D-glutamate ligase [Betaproteobacteria bacterium]